jgi:hypothetical protein
MVVVAGHKFLIGIGRGLLPGRSLMSYSLQGRNIADSSIIYTITIYRFLGVQVKVYLNQRYKTEKAVHTGFYPA